MKFKKKGAIEIQFNWIFILIAGAVILLFFGTIIVKQRDAAEQKIAASFLIDLESIITGSIVSKEALNFITIPKQEINFEGCDFYYIGKKGEAKTRLKKDVKENVIFTPDLIKGTKLTIWSLPWNIPYRVTNFLYLTSPEVRYILVYDATDQTNEELAEAIEKLLPPETITIDEEEYNVMFRERIKTLLVGTFSDLNNYKVKLVFLNIDPSGDLSAFNSMSESDVGAIKIVGDIESGTIDFYGKILNSWSLSLGNFKYYGKAALIGAIFAEDREMYECAMQNAFERLRVVTDVYISRTNRMVTRNCQYAMPLGNLNDILSYSSEFSQDNVQRIKSAGDNLLSQDKNCPLVY